MELIMVADPKFKSETQTHCNFLPDSKINDMLDKYLDFNLVSNDTSNTNNKEHCDVGKTPYNTPINSPIVSRMSNHLPPNQ